MWSVLTIIVQEQEQLHRLSTKDGINFNSS